MRPLTSQIRPIASHHSPAAMAKATSRNGGEHVALRFSIEEEAGDRRREKNST
jgi:hypothetical protein